MKVIVAGSRTATFRDTMNAIKNVGKTLRVITEVVSGCARGPDSHGKDWAKVMTIPVTEFPADWAKHGKAAGIIRNGQMAKYADALIAVWDGESRGTADMIERMRKMDKPVFVWNYKSVKEG